MKPGTSQNLKEWALAALSAIVVVALIYLALWIFEPTERDPVCQLQPALCHGSKP